MTARRIALERLYAAFNTRDVDAVLAGLHPDVSWPNGWEGGVLHGHDAVRHYWTRQWAEIDPIVQPVGYDEHGDDIVAVTVHQVVRDLAGAVQMDTTVIHTYRFDGGFVRSMEITSPAG